MLLVIASPIYGQPRPNNPHIGYVYPAGGQRGTTFFVVVGGQAMDGVGSAQLSGRGVQVTVKSHTRPLAPKEHHDLMNKRDELEKQRAAAPGGDDRRRGPGQPPTTNSVSPTEWTAAQEKWLYEIRVRLANSTTTGRLPNPAIAEIVRFQVTVSPDAELGERELRLVTPSGLSNPLKFFVGQLPEIDEKAFDIVRRPGRELPAGTAAKEMRITLPATVNGQILPGGINRYRFSARAGQPLVVVVGARALIPYISDAVPGWFQAIVTLYDAKGQELTCTDDYRFHPDPVLFYKIPAGGEYVLEIRDSLYRGREDFVYRISIGELPFVTSVFPLGGEIGTQTLLAVSGWNLPFKELPLDLRNAVPGIHPLVNQRLPNRVLVSSDTLPECVEMEPNNTIEKAQRVKLPIIINGHIDPPGDMDVYRFEGKAGDQVVAEVHARRLDSALDSLLILTDTAGKQLAFNDDHEDKGSGLNTHHADSYLAFTLPATGSYFVHIGDAQQAGGAGYSYRLRISAPRPDFELRVTPSSVNLRNGTAAPLTVHALRKDGFTGAIALRLKDAPNGFKSSGTQIPEKQDRVSFPLDAWPMSMTEPVSLNIEGYATIQGVEVVRRAVPADDMLQAFAYRHLVPAQDLKAFVARRGPLSDVERILSDTPIKLPAGGTARVRVWVPISALMGNAQLELSQPPQGIILADTLPVREGTELVLQCNAAVVKPGQKGTLTVTVVGQRQGPPGQKPSPNSPRVTLGTLPPIPFEIVAR